MFTEEIISKKLSTWKEKKKNKYFEFRNMNEHTYFENFAHLKKALAEEKNRQP